MTKNPYIEPYDYFDGYRENIEKLKNHPEYVQFDRLAYEALEMTEVGKKLIQEINKRFVWPSLANINSNNFQISCIYYEGFKDAFRLLINSVRSHEQRIKSETNQA